MLVWVTADCCYVTFSLDNKGADSKGVLISDYTDDVSQSFSGTLWVFPSDGLNSVFHNYPNYRKFWDISTNLNFAQNHLY